MNLTRFHGVFAPNSRYRADIIIQKKDNKSAKKVIRTEGEKRRAMTWAARLRRAFNMDIKTCEACDGAVKVIACIDDPVVVNKILAHLYFQRNNQVMLPVTRAPPVNIAV